MGAPQLWSNVCDTLMIISLFCRVDRQTDGRALRALCPSGLGERALAGQGRGAKILTRFSRLGFLRCDLDHHLLPLKKITRPGDCLDARTHGIAKFGK